MAAGDYTGDAECEWILTQLRTLCGGRVWEVRVPDDVEIPRKEDGSGGVKPYIIVSFASPTASAVGRNIAMGEKGQPHILTFTVKVVGAEMDDIKPVIRAAKDLITDGQPTDNSGRIKLRGGFAYPADDPNSAPGRVQKAFFGRVYINL
jgi:hypothetical protein